MISVDLFIVLFRMLFAVFLCLIAQRDHLLRALFLLELYTLVLMLMYPLKVARVGGSIGALVIRFLTMRACEGRLGLRIFVIIVRKRGTDIIHGLVSSSV